MADSVRAAWWQPGCGEKSATNSPEMRTYWCKKVSPLQQQRHKQNFEAPSHTCNKPAVSSARVNKPPLSGGKKGKAEYVESEESVHNDELEKDV